MASSTNLQSLEQFEPKLYFIKIIKFGENIADDWSTSTGSNFILKKKRATLWQRCNKFQK